MVAQSACSPAVSITEIAFESNTLSTPTIPATSTQSPTNELTLPTAAPTDVKAVRFAVIGDYGTDTSTEGDVAHLVASWNPDLVITTGDNNYPAGSAQTIDPTIGQYYQAYIHPYGGEYGQGAAENNFFPSMGNHDWITDQAQPYLDYFNLPGNERYYQFNRGPVEFFAIDSDAHEPDGVNRSSLQAEWLKQQMALSTATWKVVYFHHPPYSSALHGSVTWMRWPFQEWGADLILSGHDHTYERLQIDGLTFIVNGLGGGPIYDFLIPLPESLFRYNQDHGAMLIEADSESMQVQFFDIQGELIDSVTLFPEH
jgi:predicted MPP superfamily phosphohydrolase